MTHALLGSYAVQSLFGDYDTREHGVGTQYFSHVSFAPQQSAELLEQIAEMHKMHRSVSSTPALLCLVHRFCVGIRGAAWFKSWGETETFRSEMLWRWCHAWYTSLIWHIVQLG